MRDRDETQHGGIRRFPLEDPNLALHAAVAPWSEAVEVPPGSSLLFLSGFAPGRVRDDVDGESGAAHGDMEEQTRSVLSSIQRSLQSKGYGLESVVKLVVYFKDVPGGIDLEGFGRAYRDFFPHESPLPARSRVVENGLMRPGWLVEIEAVAARLRA